MKEFKIGNRVKWGTHKGTITEIRPPEYIKVEFDDGEFLVINHTREVVIRLKKKAHAEPEVKGYDTTAFHEPQPTAVSFKVGDVKDISNEETRTYVYPHGEYTITNPKDLYIKEGASGHRVVDKKGFTHWVPLKDLLAIQWYSPIEQVSF